jgi:S1-C subfamily serine protease
MNRRSVILTIAFALFLVLFSFNTVTAQDSTPSPFLGIAFAESEDGVVVTHVAPDSPAADVGLEEGDILTAIDGEPVDVDSLPDTISSFDVGSQIELSILRDGETLDLEATSSSDTRRTTTADGLVRLCAERNGSGVADSQPD